MDIAIVAERWLHITAGILWVGLLFYFNLVQMPAMQTAAAAGDGPASKAIMKYIVPRALLWFRWAAVVTWLAGAALLGPAFIPAFTLQPGFVPIGIGSWLGTLLLFNVWFVIWPNQKKLLGLRPADATQKARAKRTVAITARLNLVLVLPLIYFMSAQAHGGL